METEFKLDLILSYQKKLRLAAIHLELGLNISPEYVSGLARDLAGVREALK